LKYRLFANSSASFVLHNYGKYRPHGARCLPIFFRPSLSTRK
jgi:hypothetical protein